MKKHLWKAAALLLAAALLSVLLCGCGARSSYEVSEDSFCIIVYVNMPEGAKAEQTPAVHKVEDGQTGEEIALTYFPESGMFFAELTEGLYQVTYQQEGYEPLASMVKADDEPILVVRLAPVPLRDSSEGD